MFFLHTDSKEFLTVNNALVAREMMACVKFRERERERERESRGEGYAVVQDSKHLKISSEICGVLDVRYLLLPMTGKK